MSRTKIILIIFLGLVTHLGFGQSYGLQFNSHEKHLDQRTSLNLNPNNDFRIKDSFMLNFDLAFVQDQKDYFGYIIRIIANDTLNLDLLYDKTAQTINLIEGNSAKVISVPFKIKELAQFKKISITFNRSEDLFNLTIGDSTYTLKTSSFKNNLSWQFLFGLNHSKLFKTTDVPAMQLRNINLLINGEKKHEWPVNNQSGNWIKDEIGDIDAYVENPFWLYTLHNTWVLENELVFDSYTQFVQKNNSDTLYFLSSDELLTYPLSNRNNISHRPLPKKIHLPNGSKLVYNNFSNEIVYYSIDRKIYSRLNTVSLSSTNEMPEITRLTAYWQHNCFFNPQDTSLLFIGGYGYLSYKNEINKVNLNDGKWTTHLPDNKIMTPHYLSCIGSNSNKDTLYILGGYGSFTGDQKINPGYVYDLIRYIPKTNSLEKVFNYNNHGIEEFCLSNSMIINHKNSTFYTLAYSKYEYKNELKLIKGSLSNHNLEIDDVTIPFNFHDIMSYVDIIYSPVLNKFYAITSFYNDKEITSIKIYSILAEPAFKPAAEFDKNVSLTSVNKTNIIPIFLTILIIIVFVLIIIWHKKRINSRQQLSSQVITSNNHIIKQDLDNLTSQNSNQEEVEKVEIQKKVNTPDMFKMAEKNNYAISLFGGFQVISKTGENITNKFTPLLKELFLLVFLKSIGDSNNGITSVKLKEILWYDKSEKDASNNQAVNVARLKSLLEEVGQISLSKSTGYWMVEINDSLLKTDYTSYHYIAQLKKHTKDQIIDLIQIIKRGDFLLNAHYEWLDKYKAEVSSNIIDVLLNYGEEHKDDCDPSFLIQIADTVMIFDSVNEDALRIKCNSLIKEGKHSIAKKTYDIFSKEYQTLYGEPYGLSFSELGED